MNNHAEPEMDQQSNMFGPIVDRISRTMNLPVSIWVPDERRETLRIAASVGLPVGYVNRALLELDEPSITGEAFRTGRVIRVHNVQVDERWKYKDEAREMGWRSALCVPVQAHETVIAIVSIYAFVARDFSDLEIGLLTNFADQIQLTLEADRRRETLGRLLDAGHRIEELITEQPQAVLEEIVRAACQVIRADCAALYPYDPQREDFYDVDSVSAYGLNNELSISARPRRHTGLAARVKQEREVIIADIERDDPALLASPFVQREGIKAFMGIALQVASEVLGILYVDFRASHQFSEADQNTIRLFAHQAALAIHNTRSFQQAQNRVEALRSLHSISSNLISISGVSADLEAILIQIVQNAQEVLGADLIDLYQYIQSRDEYVLPAVQVGKRYQPKVRKSRIEKDDVIRGIIESREPQYFAEVQKEQNLILSFTVERPDIPPDRFVVREDISSTAAVPLVVGNEVVGVLFANYRSPQVFLLQQRELVELFANQAAIAIRNARLFEQRRTLQDIARDITGILDRDELLQSILKRSLELLGCEIGSIALLNKKTNELEFEYAIGKERYTSAPFGKGLIGSAATERKAIRVADVAQDPRYIKHAAQTRSELDVPMLIGEELVGVLNAESVRLDAFDQDDEELALVLAGQAAVAIYNADLFQRTQERLSQRLEDLKALQDVYRAVGRVPSEKVVRLVVEQAVKLTPAQYGNIRLLESEQQVLRFEAEVNLQGLTPRLEERLSVDEHSISGWVVRTGKPHLCKDVTTDKYYRQIIEDVRSELTVPLRLGDRIIGVLNLESTQLAAFTQDHQQLLEALASQAATAIENARYYDRLNALAGVSQAIMSTLELDEVLDRILEQALQALQASQGTLQLLNRSEGRLDVRAHRGAISNKTHDKLQMGEGITGWVAAHSTSFLAGDVQSPTQGQKDAAQYLPYFADTRCELAAPIKVEERTIGVLNFEHPQPYAFDEQDVRLVEAIASQAALAVRNARLYQNRQALNQIGQALTVDIRLREDEILQLIYTEASRLMDTNNMYIALYDEPTDTVRFGLAFVDGKCIDVAAEDGWQPRRAGKGKTEAIIHAKEPIFHATQAEAEAWYAQPGRQEYIGSALGCWLGVPMMVGQKVLGMIATYNANYDHVYSRDDLDILHAMANQAAIALDSAHMFYDVNRKLEALVEFGRVITSGINLRESEILRLIYDQASQLMDTDNLYIALYDQATDTVRFGLAFTAGRRIDVATEKGWQPRRAGKGKTEEIIRTKEPIFHATQAEADAWYAQPEHQEYTGGALSSWLGVPMVVGEKVLGVIATYHPTQDYVYASDDLDVLQAMANQAAVTLQNAQIFYDVDQRLRSLVEFGQEIASGFSLSELEILDLIYQYAGQLMDTDNMSVSLYDESSDTAHFALAVRNGQRVDVERERGWGSRPGLAGTGKTNHVLRTQEALLLSTFEEEEDWYAEPGRRRYIERPRASWLGVPMLAQGRVVGVIEVYHLTQEYAFSGSDLDILQSMADQAAIALYNARLYQRTRELQEEVVATQQLATLGTAMAALQHRINNTFNIIVPNVMRLRRRVDAEDETTAQILDIIDRNARYTSDIIRRIQEPLREVEKQRVNVNAVLTDVVSRARELWPAESPIDIELHLDETVPHVEAPIGQITEVFNNLLTNAHRAMAESGRITVKSKRTDDSIQVRIQDMGCGIPADIQDRLFAKPVPSKDPAEGAGLGLWLSRLMLRSIGGNVIIEETSDDGTTMLVEVPLS